MARRLRGRGELGISIGNFVRKCREALQVTLKQEKEGYAGFEIGSGPG